MKLYDDKKFIGNVIKNARKKAGLNQAQLAEKLGMSDKNLGNIENGKQFPQVNNFFRILEELNISIESFGVQIASNTSAEKDKIFKKILSCDNKILTDYLKAIELVDNIWYKK
ncbi:MAG: helix-turn-helix transcriptional regulator [Candidatus Gastranaerophilales bacterium]